MQKKRQIKITLLSDLCVGSGYSFAGIIDSDVCYDDCGIPFIPGRRLKGCMKEAAQTTLYALLSEEEVNTVFGKRGQNTAAGIYVSDARIGDYETYHKELKACMKDDKMKGIVTPHKILEMYTTIRAQTKIERESGTADDQSLRFTRIVNQMNAVTKEKMVFFADLIYEESQEENIFDILLATKNIGLHRNRGLGNVKMEWNQEGEYLYRKDVWEPQFKRTGNSNRPLVISYKIKNKEPLMLSADNRDRSVSYISGQSIIGMMASRYLQLYGQADEVFYDLFLNGTVKFSNATLCDGDCIFYPAPAYLAKLKRYKHIVNTYVSNKMLREEMSNREEYQPEGGNLPKKLKGMYVYMKSEEECAIKEPERVLIYHNRINDEDESGNHLYHHEALAAGQTFAGQIFLPEKYVDIVKKLLSGEYAWFGKSKTAQYGLCKIFDVKAPADDENKANEKHTFYAKKGDTILVTLLSDGIFIKKNADYTVYEDELLPIVAENLWEGTPDSYKENPDIPSIITTKEIHGYQSMWNLRRPPVPAVCAGSVFAFQMEKDAAISSRFIGERNQEGYGQIRVTNLNEMKYYSMTKAEMPSDTPFDTVYQSKALIQAVLQEELYQEAKAVFMKDMEKVSLKSSALLGRVTLMLKESQERQKEDAKKAFVDFSRRILSIRTKSEKEKLCSVVLEKFGLKEIDNEEIFCYHLDIGKLKHWIKGDSKYRSLLMEKLNLSENDILEYLQKRWADMLTEAFVKMKYALKNQKSESRKGENF